MTTTITLTYEQALTLRIFLLLTTSYRNREFEACRTLSAELKDDGSLMFPNMASNANFWEDTIITIDEILKIV